MEQFKIQIVEDEMIVALDMSERLKQAGYLITGISDNEKDAIKLFKKDIPDLVLLDISIKGDSSGIDVANVINSIRSTPFIYITAHADTLTVQKAKNTFPAAYLVKPFNTGSLLVSIELALHHFANFKISEQKHVVTNDAITEDNFYLKEDHVFIKDGHTFIKVYLYEILYLESEDNYIRITTKSKTFLVRSTLSRALEKLEKSYFLRIHRSFVVNLNNISSFSEQEVSIGNTIIPVGRNYKEDFVKQLRLK